MQKRLDNNKTLASLFFCPAESGGVSVRPLPIPSFASCHTVKANCQWPFADSEAEKAPPAGATRQRASSAPALVVIPFRINGFYNTIFHCSQPNVVVIPLRMVQAPVERVEGSCAWQPRSVSKVSKSLLSYRSE